jgi:hypothetical protein
MFKAEFALVIPRARAAFHHSIDLWLEAYGQSVLLSLFISLFLDLCIWNVLL